MAPLWSLFFAILALLNIQVNAAPPQHPVRISEALFKKFHRYTTFASASYRENCTDPPFGSSILNYMFIKNTTTQAVLYKHDELKELILAFPGTRGPVDSEDNKHATLVPYRTRGVQEKDCPKCRVHKGWLTNWNDVSQDVVNALDHALKHNKHYKVIITGHSMGGALTALATGSLRKLRYPIEASYSFGQPRTGNIQFANFIDHINGVRNGSRGHFHRVTHASDGVPQVPKRRPGRYHHHSTEYWQRNDKSGGQDAHRTFRCFGQEPANCNESTNPTETINSSHGYYSDVNMGAPGACNSTQS